MTLRHLRIFIEVANTGKMCDAADNLFISQPTVSQAIKEIETHYNTLLFERLGRTLHITNFGERLLFLATNLVNDFDEMDKKMMAIGEEESLNIGATITIGRCILPGVINDLKERIPNLDIYSCISNTKSIEEQLLRSELDVAIVEGNINNPNLVSIPALKDTLVLACSSEHELAKNDIINNEHLNGQDFILREEGSGTRKLFEDYIDRNGIDINVVMESNCPGTISASVLENNYLSVMSSRLIEREVSSGNMSMFNITSQLWDRTFKIAYHKDKRMNSTLQAFIDLLEDMHKKPYMIPNKKKIVHLN